MQNYELATVDLLPEEEVKSKVKTIADSVRDSASTRLISFVNYINTNTRSNGFISALNMNTRVAITLSEDRYLARYFPTTYYDFSLDLPALECANAYVLMPAVFFSTANHPNHTTQGSCFSPDPNYEFVAGFVAACTPLESFLVSALECLHDTDCLRLLLQHFPSPHRVHPMIFSHSVHTLRLFRDTSTWTSLSSPRHDRIFR